MPTIVKKKILLFVFFLCYFTSCETEGERRQKEYLKLIGTYEIDTILSKLDDYKDSMFLFSTLTLILKADCTYFQNRSVPFIEDTFGRWNAGPGDFETYNYICNNSMAIEGSYHLDEGTQFSYIGEDFTIDFQIKDSLVGVRRRQNVVFKKVLTRK